MLEIEELEFEVYRKNTIGYRHPFVTPYGTQTLLYADWAASGRLYRPIEQKLAQEIGPLAGNPHTAASLTGTAMTSAYEEAKRIIKHHVHAGPNDILLFEGTGMTGAVNKLQRLLGLKVPAAWRAAYRSGMAERERPVVFITHMEHHSNHISWAETIGEVVCLPPGADGRVDPAWLDFLLRRYRERRVKIGAFTACSNVTGFVTPIHELARVMHRHGGICVADYSASAPYVPINMHPPGAPEERLDAILFSPHKFLGGPGTSGVLVMNAGLSAGASPDRPGGGTVSWTSPWGLVQYLSDAESREDGGTPGVMQAARTALCLRLKEKMGAGRLLRRERELTDRLLSELETVPGLTILGGPSRERLGIVSFTLDQVHYNLAVKLLNDHFGIQARGGCSCAGTYGHYLLGIDQATSQRIARRIASGDFTAKPGWIRISLHPIMTADEVAFIGYALRQVAARGQDWARDYSYDPRTNEWSHRRGEPRINLDEWFRLPDPSAKGKGILADEPRQTIAELHIP
ncbi:aminotransferase, class V [Paenibacillus sp. oral taxon 786 str. D14]|uniref:aminotransferase class V-fold PLP-dependent enzyme n=1 Tax=Paenibacillus sp. oral taxon 786 TaxID=652715 RepID=UPI0001AFCC3D|nr:aminotransferase class V-fold PLP-dependent enzyme [Paenibacillus sp. oral taxon 786]EES74522.1 aminotransferase, class V [Paenibacillus sp. oral taxon 786 str. D14]